MYRAPDTTIRCASCSGTSVSSPTLLDPTKGFLQGHFNVREVSFAIDRVRICFDCGHVSLAVSAARLAALKAHGPLQPFDPA